MPFQNYAGGGDSPFVSNSEGADATLNINLPDDAARNLWDVQAAIQQIATDFQTAVRSAADFSSYLITMRETSQTIKMPALGMEGGEGGNLTYAGGRVDRASVPISQSEAGQISRVGEMVQNQADAGASGGAMAASELASRSQRGPNLGELLGGLANSGFVFDVVSGRAQGQHGGRVDDSHTQIQSQQPSYSAAAQFGGSQGQTAAGGASNVAQAYTNAVSQGLPAFQSFMHGGGLGGAAAMLGKLGAAGAVAYSTYQLGDAAFRTYAQGRSMGIATNNSNDGTMWGLGVRAQQAAMAMSPYVSSEEAGQIYSSAIDQGWASGRGANQFQQGSFGQAVNFMYNAAKDYNMDPAMSSQLLQTNALGAGESVQALSEQLLSLKKSLDGTGVSMDAANSTFTSFTSMLIASGASGPGAAQVAGGALNAYAGNTYLGPSGRGAAIVSQTLGTTQTQNILAGLTGHLPGSALAGSHLAGSTAELDKLTKQFADQVMNMGNLDEPDKAAMFMQLYNGTFGTNIDEQDALNMMAENVSNPGLLSAGQKKYLDSQKISYKNGKGPNNGGRGFNDRYTGQLGDDWNNNGILGKIGTIAGMSLTGGALPLIQQAFGGSDHAQTNYSPEVQNLIDNSADSNKITVIDPSGKVLAQGADSVSHWFADQGNFDKFNAAGSKYTIHDANGKGSTWNATNIGGSANTLDQAGANSNNTVYITLSPQAKQYFDTNKSSLNLSSGSSVANTGN